MESGIGAGKGRAALRANIKQTLTLTRAARDKKGGRCKIALCAQPWFLAKVALCAQPWFKSKVALCAQQYL
jgi:hypothetical protein